MTFICPNCKKQIDPEEKYIRGIYYSTCPECKQKIKRWKSIDKRNYVRDKKGTITRKVAKPHMSKAEKKAAIRAKHNKE